MSIRSILTSLAALPLGRQIAVVARDQAGRVADGVPVVVTARTAGAHSRPIATQGTLDAAVREGGDLVVHGRTDVDGRLTSAIVSPPPVGPTLTGDVTAAWGGVVAVAS